jgi:hypothetical protein
VLTTLIEPDGGPATVVGCALRFCRCTCPLRAFQKRLYLVRAPCSLTRRPPAPTDNSARPVEAAVAQLLPKSKNGTPSGARNRRHKALTCGYVCSPDGIRTRATALRVPSHSDWTLLATVENP